MGGQTLTASPMSFGKYEVLWLVSPLRSNWLVGYAEMIENLSLKCIRAYKNTLYTAYHRNFNYITLMI